ncbi:hypothetical protein N7470_002012 [Penicillium chermesinum]|nr:hypothetical protein N7470_002012 [Penicillium chermesinum]
MPGNDRRSLTSAGSESGGGIRPRPSDARAEQATNAITQNDASQFDTALPPIIFQTPIAHRRTGSTLKTVMRKIFNRKRESQTQGVEESPGEQSYTTLQVRRTGPNVEGKSFLAIPTPTGSKQSSPLSEENLQMAEAHLSPTSLGAGLPSPRRRATLPSVIFSDEESHYGVAPSAVSDPQEDRSEPHWAHTTLRERRRSRSTDALRQLAHEQKFQQPSPWPLRKSSIPSPSETQSPPRASPPGGGSSASGHSVRPSTGTTVTSVTRASESHFSHASQVSLPPNVGTLVHTMQHHDGLTVEQRLNTIEVKMIDLEFAIARMQSNTMDASPTERSSRTRQAPAHETPSHKRNKPPLANLPTARPTSTSTIRPENTNSGLRPTASASSLNDFNAVSIEQYSALITLLRREQTARRNLESQVSGLRDDIRHIQRAALQSMEMGTTMYPIHSDDSQEFLRFRRALDDSNSSSSPIRSDEDRGHSAYEADRDWDRDEIPRRDDPIGPHKWTHGQMVTTTNMI